MVCKILALPSPSSDTVEVLKYLLREAEAGKITGLAFVAIQHGPDYSTGVIGRARQTPTLTRGMLQVLEDEVRSILHPSLP
jgi:hypothetical protein